jgi:hypothetical protein
VTRLEERLREACREAVGTVRPEAIRGLDLEADPRAMGTQRAVGTRRAVRPRRRGRVLAPLAAAASVAVIAVGATLVVPRLSGGAPGHTGRPRHASRPATGGLAALPKYTVLNNGEGLEVIVTATGRVASRLSAPAGRAFAAIAATASDRMFFVAADLNPQTSCQAFFYQFRLGADGRPSALTPLPAGPLPGLPTALAASATGRLVAYSVVGCAGDSPGHIGGGQPIGHIGLIDLAAGRIARKWSYTLGEDYTSDLSMSADGRLLGYSNFLNGSQVGRVLAASAPSGSDQRSSRIVVREPGATALSASGRLMYAMTGTHDQVLAAYDTASGQRVTVLHRWPAAMQPGPLVADPAGGYLLLPVTGTPARRTFSPYVKGRRCFAVTVVDQGLKCARVSMPQTLFVGINLATGAATTLPFRESGPVGWGTVAW